MQRARDGWARYTSNTGRLLPNYRDIEVEGEEERLPHLGNSDFYAWQTIPLEDSLPSRPLSEQPEVPFVPSQLLFEQAPTPPLPDGDENFGADLPSLVPIEEAESSNQEEKRRSRPMRQLRIRSVARSVAKDRRVQFGESVERVERDHQ